MTANLIPFSFESHEIRTTQDEHSTPWFVAKDICAALGISWSGSTLAPIKAEWKGVMKFITPGGNQELAIVCEQAVYKLAFRSRKPEAERFTDWVADTIATIRKTGQYIAPRHRADKTRKALPGALTVEQQDAVKALVKSKVEMLPHSKQGGAVIKCWSSIKSKFGVGYKEVPAEQFTEVLSLVARLPLEGEVLPPPAEEDPYQFPLNFWNPENRKGSTGWLTWAELARVEPMDRPLSGLLARLTRDGHDVEGARVEYQAMRLLLESMHWTLSDIANRVNAMPRRGLNIAF